MKRSHKMHLANGGCVHGFSYVHHQLRSSLMNMRFILAHSSSWRRGRYNDGLLSDNRSMPARVSDEQEEEGLGSGAGL